VLSIERAIDNDSRHMLNASMKKRVLQVKGDVFAGIRKQLIIKSFLAIFF
jgi:hypothetical protein